MHRQFARKLTEPKAQRSALSESVLESVYSENSLQLDPNPQSLSFLVPFISKENIPPSPNILPSTNHSSGVSTAEKPPLQREWCKHASSTHCIQSEKPSRILQETSQPSMDDMMDKLKNLQQHKVQLLRQFSIGRTRGNVVPARRTQLEHTLQPSSPPQSVSPLQRSADRLALGLGYRPRPAGYCLTPGRRRLDGSLKVALSASAPGPSHTPMRSGAVPPELPSFSSSSTEPSDTAVRALDITDVVSPSPTQQAGTSAIGGGTHVVGLEPYPRARSPQDRLGGSSAGCSTKGGRGGTPSGSRRSDLVEELLGRCEKIRETNGRLATQRNLPSEMRTGPSPSPRMRQPAISASSPQLSPRPSDRCSPRRGNSSALSVERTATVGGLSERASSHAMATPSPVRSRHQALNLSPRRDMSNPSSSVICKNTSPRRDLPVGAAVPHTGMQTPARNVSRSFTMPSPSVGIREARSAQRPHSRPGGMETPTRRPVAKTAGHRSGGRGAGASMTRSSSESFRRTMV